MAGPTWGENLLTGVAAGFFGNPYVRDYTHASKTFLPNAYENAPKLKFLFHTVFETNQEVLNIGNTNLSVLVKSVKLPSFNIETQQLNQYNRKRINQTKIKYDPVDITFHDDSGNLISSLWYRYYTYYYRDGQNPKVVFNGAAGNGPGSESSGAPDVTYNQRTQYQPSKNGFTNWGYTGQGVPTSSPDKKIPFFNNITIFGINRHEFISYTLINPVITRFGHDTYDYDQGNGVMTNSMTIDYETVVYNQGAIEGGDKSGNIIKGFGDQAVYDKRISPIQTAGGNQKIIGKGGLIDAAGGFVNSLDGSLLGGINAIRTAGIAYNTFKNANLGGILKTEAQNILTRGVTNALVTGNISAIPKAFTDTLKTTSNPTRNADWEIPMYKQSGSNTNGPLPGVAGPQNIGGGTTPTAGTQNPDPTTGNYVP